MNGDSSKIFTVSITFAVEPELDVKIRKAARKRGLTRSAWLRTLILDSFANTQTK